MIGFYNYTVILTYMSLLSAMIGMTFATTGHFKMAVFCLALSGFFDMFDGIQLDSLCDVVAFGALPGLLCYCLGVRGSLGMLAIGFYCICGVIRLAFFNVIETNNFFSEEEHEKVYHGLPITSIAVILPLIFLLRFVVTTRAFVLILIVMLFGTGTLFIADFKMKKPSNKVLALLVLIVAAAIAVTFAYSKHLLPAALV